MIGSGFWNTISCVELEPLHPIQIERFSTMTFAEKWRVAQGMLRLARNTRLRVMAQQFSEATEEERERMVAQEFLRGRT